MKDHEKTFTVQESLKKSKRFWKFKNRREDIRAKEKELVF